MAIDSISGRKPDLTATKTLPKSEPDSSKKISSNSAVKDDTVAITNTAREIKKVSAASPKAMVDMERVSSIKKALADGSYTVDAKKVAQKMVEFEKSFLENNSS